MAITAAQLQAELGATNPLSPQVVRHLPPYTGTVQHWYIHGRQAYGGRVKRISTTAADSAADQATAVRAALLAGPA